MNLASICELQAGHQLHYRMMYQGLPISIENRKGSVRRGKDPKWGKWSVKMSHPYGYIRGTMGVDGDEVDCFIGPDENAANAYIIHTRKAPEFKNYDEDKAMLGFKTAADAKQAFLANFNDSGFFGSMDTIPMEKFKQKALATKVHPQRIAAMAESKLEAILHVAAGGIGSGCRGPNCGRKSTGRIQPPGDSRSMAALRQLVDQYAQKYGAKNLRMTVGALRRWQNCSEFGDRCTEKGLGPAVALWKAAGLSYNHAESHYGRLVSWMHEPTGSLARLSQKVVAGRVVRDNRARALALESLVGQKMLGNRTMTLYRGVDGTYAQNAMRTALRSGGDIVVKSRGADSWSDHKEDASGFGPVVLAAKVPANYVMASHRTNDALRAKGEHEFIVAFPHGRIPVDREKMDLALDAASAPIEVDLTDHGNFRWMRKHRENLQAIGEPGVYEGGYAHMAEPNLLFHPPSLRKKKRVPTDDPGETDNRFLDVSKRKSKATKKMRDERTRRVSPPAQLPGGSTAVQHHTGFFLPFVTQQ